MTRSSWAHPYILRQVFHLSEQRAPYDGIDIVVVPDIGSQALPDKGSRECPWMKPLVAATDDDARVFHFKYKVQKDDDGSPWGNLLSLGSFLLDSLRQARSFDSERRPLFFIAHGFGGLIVKEALFQAYQCHQPTRNALSAIVFLGCPHLTSPTDDDHLWSLWPLIMKTNGMSLPRDSLKPNDKAQLAKCCFNFSKVTAQWRILSIYELHKTKIREGLAFRRRPTVLVDQHHARTNREGEDMIGAETSHDKLLFVKPEDSLFKTMVHFFRSAPRFGLETVNAAYERQRINLDPELQSDDEGVPDPENLSRNSSMSWEHCSRSQTYSSITSDVSPARVLLPCYILPYNHNSTFCGREAVLKNLEGSLIPDSDIAATFASPPATLPRVCAIHGLGGIGKTHIASEFCHRYKTKYQAIFWISSANMAKLDAGYLDIAVKLGLQHEQSVLTDTAATRKVVKEWLINPRIAISTSAPRKNADMARWLIIFDNVEDPDILADFWPSDGPGSVLITSRNPLAGRLSFGSVNAVTLPPMSKGECTELLFKIAQIKTGPDFLETGRKISEKLGGLPIAIVQMAHAIRRKGLSLQDFLDYYEEDAKTLHECAAPGYTQIQTLAWTWNIEGLRPTSAALLHVMCVLDPDRLQDRLLCGKLGELPLADYPKTKPAYFDAREELMKSSLISRHSELGFLSIHRLVQEVVRQKLSIELLRATFDSAVALVSSIWPFLDAKNLNEINRARSVAEYLPHTLALKDVLDEAKVGKLQPGLEVCGLFNDAAWELHSPREAQMGRELCHTSQSVIEKTKHDNPRLSSRLLSDSYRHEGIIAIYQNDKSAISLLRKWISCLVERIEKFSEDEDRRLLPVAYNEVGLALMRIPDEVEAVRSFELSRETLKQTTPSNRLVFPYPWVHLSLIASYGGDAVRGEKILRPILEAREARLGKNDRTSQETPQILVYLGNIRLLQGDMDESFHFHRRGKDGLADTSGKHTAFYAHSCYRLAVDYFARRDYDSALKLLQECNSIYGDLDAFEAEAARTNWKQGRALLCSGGRDNVVESEKLLSLAMERRRSLKPEDTRPEAELQDADWDSIVYYFWR